LDLGERLDDRVGIREGKLDLVDLARVAVGADDVDRGAAHQAAPVHRHDDVVISIELTHHRDHALGELLLGLPSLEMGVRVLLHLNGGFLPEFMIRNRCRNLHRSACPPAPRGVCSIIPWRGCTRVVLDRAARREASR